MTAMRLLRTRHLLLLCVSASLVAAACSKKKDADTAPAPAATGPESSEGDPRLAPSPGEGSEDTAGDPHAGLGGDAGADNPHAGMGGDNPHAGMGGDNPHAGVGGGDSPHAGMGMGMGGPGKAPDKTADGRVILGPVTLAVPKSWQEKTPSSSMRAATWAIPGKAGEAELAVFYFGTGGAGGAQANLDRWLGQFEQSDGSKSADKAKIEKKEIAGMPVTTVEVTGRYVASMTPGASEKRDNPDFMMLAAIVETSGGPYYYKLVGPKDTVSASRKDFRGFIESQKPGAK
jgi:hypothetical protein